MQNFANPGPLNYCPIGTSPFKGYCNPILSIKFTDKNNISSKWTKHDAHADDLLPQIPSTSVELLHENTGPEVTLVVPKMALQVTSTRIAWW